MVTVLNSGNFHLTEVALWSTYVNGRCGAVRDMCWLIGGRDSSEGDVVAQREM